jgi:hypothetical protein
VPTPHLTSGKDHRLCDSAGSNSHFMLANPARMYQQTSIFRHSLIIDIERQIKDLEARIGTGELEAAQRENREPEGVGFPRKDVRPA